MANSKDHAQTHRLIIMFRPINQMLLYITVDIKELTHRLLQLLNTTNKYYQQKNNQFASVKTTGPGIGYVNLMRCDCTASLEGLLISILTGATVQQV